MDGTTDEDLSLEGDQAWVPWGEEVWIVLLDRLEKEEKKKKKKKGIHLLRVSQTDLLNNIKGENKGK